MQQIKKSTTFSQYDIDELLLLAVNKGASDVHISSQSPPMCRLYGELKPLNEEIVTSLEIEDMIRMLLQDNFCNLNEVQELEFIYQLEDTARFRMNIYKQRGVYSIAARVVPQTIPSIEQLQMPETLTKLISKQQGLVLVTGPSGSGKTTTLASMLDYINNTLHKHIITLENSIEFNHRYKCSLIHQRELGSDTASPLKGLQDALRQDPDIVMLEDMKDADTIMAAITAAESGLLVVASLPTNSATETINWLIDAFPLNEQAQINQRLASVLRGITSQRLFTKQDFSGKVVATEVLLGYPSVINLIKNGKTQQIEQVMESSSRMGMHTLDMSIHELMKNGLISIEQATPYILNAAK